MPPATTMAANDMYDPFSQFGQLSLDGGSDPTTLAPETPPQAPKTDMNPPGMTAGCQFPNQPPPQQQQQQPMQISPEHRVNPTTALFAQQQGMQQPPSGYANYQHNSFGQQPAQMMQQQQQQLAPQYQYSAQARANPQQYQQQQQAFLTSPPISPLWGDHHPGSPETPPDAVDGARNPAGNKGAAPSLPAGFGRPYGPTGSAGGMAVPTLSPGAPPATAANPFDVFAPPAVAPAAPLAAPFGAGSGSGQPAPVQEDEADFWNDMGFGVQPGKNDNGRDGSPGNVTPHGSDASLSSVTSDTSDNNPYNHAGDNTPVALDERGLPVGGAYYKARVTTSMLGAIFSSGREVRSTLYKTASDSFVDVIGDRPVISFTIDGSAADTAGIGLGHVLLKVNDTEVGATDEAVKTVGAASRPMTMEFYAPSNEFRVTKTEGQCMVKYDNHSTEAPASACEWKPKYVVAGDMLGKPHILYMYRSKGEYDIAVKESQTRRGALSVKVKQFDVRGAKIFHERGTVHYPNNPKWHYFTVVRGTGLPIKISAPSWEELQPVYDGVVAFLDNEARVKRARMEASRERMNAAGMYRETYY